MRVEDLMKPRYKVIADYPNNYLGVVGTILDRDWAKYLDDDESKIAIWRISQYPHLFKKLEWWEDRKNEDMPEYVKHSFNGKTWVYKIESWDMVNLRGNIDLRSGVLLGNMKTEFELQPATEEEFNQNK